MLQAFVSHMFLVLVPCSTDPKNNTCKLGTYPAYMHAMNNTSKTTAQVATAVGVSKDTLLRWMRQGLIKEPKRDKRGWRLFSSVEVSSIRDYAQGHPIEARSVRESATAYATAEAAHALPHLAPDNLDDGSFNVHVLSGIYRRAHDLMRNLDGLQPQEAFDELLKYISLKEAIEKHGIDQSSPFTLTGGDVLSSVQTEQATKLRRIFSEHFQEMGQGAAELWKDARFRLSDKCLIGLHDLFQPLQFSRIPFDLRSAALREFLAAHTRKALGIFLTPDDVARMMVEFVSPRPGDKVCDPACGTATFLIEVLKHWQKLNATAYDSKKSDFTVFGIDKNPRMLLLADLNLHHTRRCIFRSQLADSLAKGTIKQNTCDAIFTNPPFGVNLDDKGMDLSVYESARMLASGGARRVPSEVLFLELCLRSLTPGGTLAIVLPRSVVTNGSLDAARRAFDQYGYVQAVVSLPSETFQATGTQTTTVVLFARKYSLDEDRKATVRICVSNVSNVGYDATGRKREGNQLVTLAEQLAESIASQKDVGTCSLTVAVPKSATFSSLPEMLAKRVARGKTVCLSEILTSVTCGRTPPRASYTPDGLFVVKVGNLTGNGIDWSPRDRNFVDPSVYRVNSNGEHYLRTGDILLTAAAHSPVYIAKKVDIVTVIPPDVGSKASFVGEVMLLRVDAKKVDPFVLLAYLRLPSVTKEIQAMIRGQTAHLYPDDVLNLTVDERVVKPDHTLRKLADLARQEGEKFAELNTIMFKQTALAAELDAK